MYKSNNRIIYILVTIVIIQTVLLIAVLSKKEKVILKPKGEIQKIAKPKAVAGKIAIVLDDWGYNLSGLKILENIKEPLTLAVLPNLRYSSQIAQAAKNLDKEIILHLPLEPYGEDLSHFEHNTILTTMSKSEILRILDEDIKSLGSIKGVSNHMGSKATEDEPLMNIIFDELKKRNLYFLDSFTSRTICKKISDSKGVPYLHRHVFLDNKNDREYILSQIAILQKAARQKGFAIGIGHCRILTLRILEEVMPELKKNGYKFVFVSDLLN